jgi:hypothetical protein
VRVQIREGLLRSSQALIRANPRIEVGGKYVGYIRAAGEYLDLQIVDYIDAGPRAHRSATSHLPDADYQVRTFRAMEAADPEIQHLGSWHSHHPNGYGRLSPGDVDGYVESVNSEDHLPNVFLASLAVDARGLETANHFVFVKGAKDFYSLPHGSVTVVPGLRRFYASSGTVAAPESTGDGADWRSSEPGQALIARLNAVLVGHFSTLTTLTRAPAEIVWRRAAERPAPDVRFEVALCAPNHLRIRIDRTNHRLTYAFDPQGGEVGLRDVPRLVENLLTWQPTAPEAPTPAGEITVPGDEAAVALAEPD